jgi:hypothetical protein
MQNIFSYTFILLLLAPFLCTAEQPEYDFSDSDAFSEAWVLPSLTEMGLTYSYQNSLSAEFSSRIALEYFNQESQNHGLIDEEHSFLNFRGSLFLDAHYGERVYFFAEARVDKGEPPRSGSLEARMEQYFLRYSIGPEQAHHMQAGKFAAPFGNFIPRHQSTANPFIRPPLPYDHRSVMCPKGPFPEVDGWLTWKDRRDEFPGTPMIWEVPYPTGAMIFGEVQSVHYQLGLFNSALSATAREWEADRGWHQDPNVMGRVAGSPLTGLTLGASFARGPWLEYESVKEQLRRAEINDSIQITYGLDLAYSIGHFDFFAEAIHNIWKVPNIDESATDTGVYTEGKYTILPGLFGALRWGRIYYNDISTGSGREEAWEYDVQRIDIGLGYHIAKNVMTRIQYQYNDIIDASYEDEDLLALQVELEL